MTIDITAQLRRVQHVGSGTGPYQVPFEILEETDLQVYQDATLLTLTTHYTVAINGDGTSAVTTVSSMTGSTVTILGARPYERITDYSTGGDFFASTINDELDSLQIQIQQLNEVDARTLKAAVSDDTDLDMTLPVAATRANKFLAFNSDGEPIQSAGTGTDTGLREDLADTDTDSTGAGLVNWKQSGAGAVERSVQTVLREIQVSAKDFGAVGNNVADDTVALQAAIDYCVANRRKLFIPTGDYKITSPLFLYKWSGTEFSFFSVSIEGEKQSWPAAAGTALPSTQIIPTFNDTFAIGIQGGRAISIRNVTLLGKNAIAATINADFNTMMTNSTFVTGGARDSRYSPYAGICIDPFGTAAQPDGGYPGLSAFYVASAVASSQVVLENVVCQEFVVGTMITPNDDTLNAENITFRNCQMIFNKAGVAVGHSQSRVVDWYDGNCAYALYCFDGNTYGRQQGTPPRIWGCNMNGKYLFNTWNRTGTPLLAEGIHAESFGSIGFLGGSPATSSAAHKLAGCMFHLGDFTSFADMHLIAQGSVDFDTCSFTQDGNTFFCPMRMYHRNGTFLKFTNCSFGIVEDELFLAPTEGAQFLEMDGLIFDGSVVNDAGARGPTSGQARLSHFASLVLATTPNRDYAPNGAFLRFHGGTATNINFIGGAINRVSLGTVAVTEGADGSATFTVADGTIVRTGDMVYTDTSANYENFAGSTFAAIGVCLGIVTDVTGNDITITGWPQSLADGNYALVKEWWSRYHQASVGDTHSNTTVDNVTNPATWANGNAIKGAGIPAGAYIVSGGGTATLTISIAATATAAGVRLFDADVNVVTGTAV